MDKLSLSFPASLKYIRLAQGFGSTMAQIICQKLPSESRNHEFIYSLELVISETCTNSIIYGEDNANQDIHLECEIDDQLLKITIIDRNQAFPFDNVKQPDLNNHPESGYGIFLIKKIMDDVIYERINDSNHLTMIKKFPCRI